MERVSVPLGVLVGISVLSVGLVVKLWQTYTQFEHEQKLRQEERTGRTKAEKVGNDNAP
jgi:hypothetical protein